MATKTINQKITISGGDEIARTLRDLARLGEQAFKQLGEAASKIDLNLPIDKVKQQLVELGRSGQEAFGQLAQAAEKSVSSVKEVGTASQGSAKAVAEISPAAQKVAQDVAAIGPAAQQGLGGIQQQAEAATSALSNIGTAVKVVGVTLGGLAATFSGLAIAATAMGKTASDAVISIGRAADSAGVSISNFSRASTLLQQFGLTSDQSAAAIKRLGELSQTAFDGARAAMQRAGDTGGQTVTALQRALQGTEQTLEQIARTGGTAAAKYAQGAKVIVNEVALQNEQTRAKFAQQMASMADITINGKRIFDEATAAILKFAGAFNEVTGATRAPTEVLTQLADRLQKIPDAAERARVLTTIFGKELGTALLPALERGTAAFVNMIGTIDRLRLSTTEAERKVGQDFRAAWDLLQAVIKKNNEEIGLLIAKPLTPFINQFAEAMRRGEDTFKLYKEAIEKVMPVIGKFLDEIAKIGKVDATFPEKLKQGVQAFGDAVGAIFTNVIIPAFNGLKQIATDVAEAMTTLFGTKVTPTMVALGAAVTVLLGPIKALGIALLALFGSGAGGGQQSAGVAKLSENLKTLGIDLTAIRQGFVEFGQQIPGIISTVVEAFKGLGFVLQTIAGMINTVLGREVITAAGVAVVFAVGTMTDAFRGMAFVLVSVGAGLTILEKSLGALAIVLRGIAFVTGWPVILAAGIVTLIINFENLSRVLQIVADALNRLIGINLFSGEGLSVAAIGLLTAAFIKLAFAAGLANSALLALFSTLLTLGAIWQDVTRKMDPAQEALEKINKEFARTGDLEEYNRAMKELKDTQDKIAAGKDVDVGSMWQRMKAEADKAIAGITGTSQQGANAVGTQWGNAGQKVVDGFRQIRPGVFERIVTDAKQAGDKAVQDATETARKVDTAYRQIRPGVFERIVTESKEAAPKITQPITEAVKKVEQTVVESRNVVAEAFRDLQTGNAIQQADALRDALNRIAQQARDTARELQQLESGTKQGTSEGKQDIGPQSLFEAIDKAGQRINQFLKTDIPAAILPAVQSIFDAVESIFATTGAKAEGAVPGQTEKLVAPFTAAQTQIATIVDAIKAKIDEIAQKLQGIGGGAPAGGEAGGGGIGAGLVTALQQALTQIEQMVPTAIQNIVAQFQMLGPQIAAALATVAVDPFQPLVQQAQNAVNFIIQTFAQLGTALLAPFEAMRTGVDGILQGVGQLVTSTFESINSAIGSAASAVNSAIEQIIASLQAAVAQAQALAQAAADAAAQASAARSGSGFARGGYTGDVGVRRVAGVVHGGEYVEPAHVVRQPGVRAFLETLRRVGNLREALRRFSKGFSVGGFVDDLAGRMSGALVPGYAAGGLVPQVATGAPRNLGVLRLDVGGEQLQVRTDEATAFKLQRFARRQAMTSGGRAPVWER